MITYDTSQQIFYFKHVKTGEAILALFAPSDDWKQITEAEYIHLSKPAIQLGPAIVDPCPGSFAISTGECVECGKVFKMALLPGQRKLPPVHKGPT